MPAIRLPAILLALSCLAGAAAHAAPPMTSDKGVLTDAAGMTLYTFDKDVAGSGKSVCNDACAKAWPPLMASADDAAKPPFSLVTRDDGTRQWAHAGKPLYLFQKDTKPGEMTGDNFKEVWHVVKP